MIPNKKLIGREPEIEKMNRLLSSNQAEFLAVYGRRRVGKTYLIRQHLKDHIVFDFTGVKEAETNRQLINFFDEFVKITGIKKRQTPTSWYDAFNYLAAFLQTMSKKKKKQVIFIDEMPWLDKPKSQFIPALEYFWNHYASNIDNVLLIACGSASSWIKKKLVNARGGLYNRVTERIQLFPFNLHETELFIKTLGVNMPRYQILELYMAMGGIPFYLKAIRKGKSAAQLIDAICFSPSGLLREEYTQLYHSLFKNAEHHITIIEALAAKPQGLMRQELAQNTKINEGSLSRALEELVECDFISIYYPFSKKKKTSIYKLTDLYTLFYLKFIQSNKKKGAGTWAQLSQQSTFKAWSGYAFENICMAHEIQIKKALGISGVYTNTSAWKFPGNDAMPGAQIDMIIDRADQTIHLCEAKFTKGALAINKRMAEQLRAKKSIFRDATKTKKLVFTTLLTTFPALKNKYYLGEIENEVTMDKLFEPN
jgi:uncharacterized protein